eukprot:3472187-Prymnesium_polylepis.1
MWWHDSCSSKPAASYVNSICPSNACARLETATRTGKGLSSRQAPRRAACGRLHAAGSTDAFPCWQRRARWR